MLANVKFWLAIPGVALLNWLTIADEWNLARQESSLVYFLVSKEGLGVFFILITLMAALPFGGCFLEDKRSRFFRYCLERGSLTSYCISKVVTAYVGAFLCVFLGDCLIFGILGTGVPFLTESQVEFQVFSQSRYYGTMTQGAPILYCNGIFFGSVRVCVFLDDCVPGVHLQQQQLCGAVLTDPFLLWEHDAVPAFEAAGVL